jgi:hypothetical protein
MTRRRYIPVLTICCVFALAGSAGAETYELDGQSTWNPVSVSTITLEDGRTVTRQVLNGTAINHDPGTPLSFASQDCMFTTVTSADGKSFSSGGYCDGIDKDGDVYWAYGKATENGGKWWYLGGTGKFEGLEGGGTYQLALEWPDGKVMATWDGTATMK